MSSSRNLVPIGLASLAFALAGCGSGDGMSNGTQPPIQGLQPTLGSIQNNVFTPICTGCHSGGNPPQGLSLAAGASAANLINVHSPQDANLVRVIPGDPDHSLLIQKLEGTQTVGQRMPRGGPFLDQSTINVIRQWIANGASTQ